MAPNGHSHDHDHDHDHDHGDEIEVSPVIFQDLSDLEKEFANVEIDALRRKEYNLASLYVKRTALLNKIPSFWPQVLLNGPQEFQDILSHDVDEDSEIGNIDIATIGSITSISVERYHITSETQGEPRSLRFTFEFDKSRNPVFEDEKVVKEFEYISTADGETGSLVSKPVTFKWTKKGKKLIQAKTDGVLDLVVELYQAEEAARFNLKGKDGKKSEDVDLIQRESLWQYEKLREKLEKIEDKVMEGDDDGTQGCWLDWFGYRGPVDMLKPKAKKDSEKVKKNISNGDDDDFEGFDEEDEEDDLLDVEIFPAGERVAIALAEDLWPNVMDYFMAAQDPLSDDDEDDEDDDEVPDLIDADDVDLSAGDEDEDKPDTRPSKKQRMM